MPPAWILDIFAALMLAVSALSAARLVAARPWQPGAVITDSDVSHLLMGIAMAGMLTAGLSTLSNTAWEVVFAVLTVWFGYRVLRDIQDSGVRALAGGHCAPHLVHSGAMVYMFGALTSGGMAGMSGMSGMGGSSGSATLAYPTLAFVLGLILVGYSVWDLDQLFGGSWRSVAAAVPGAASPALAGVAAGAGIAEAAAPALSGGATSGAPAAETASGPAGHAAGHAARGGRTGATGILASPEIVVGCRIAMGVTMALMLFIMI